MSFHISRRDLFGVAASLALAHDGFAAPSDAAAPPVLVFAFLRGALDGLSAVVPYREAAYYELRPDIAIAPPRRSSDAALDLDGDFGLHPALAALLPAYRDGQLSLVHAVGSPDPTRSHFDAQDFMELATPGQSRGDGWLTRALERLPSGDDPPAVALEEPLPRSLSGEPSALALRGLRRLRADRDGPVPTAVRAGFAEMYRSQGGGVVRNTGAEGFALLDRLKPLIDLPSRAKYPHQDSFAASLADVAKLVRARVGRVFTVSAGNWDTHRAQGAAEGRLASGLRSLAMSLQAFREDLDDDFERTLVLVVTEFGRTVRQNGTGGTDHGHGSVMFALGGKVRGGKVYGSWPGLTQDRLYDGRDLAVTTDFRDVFGEVASKHLGVSDVSKLFPGYALDPARALGLFDA